MSLLGLPSLGGLPGVGAADYGDWHGQPENFNQGKEKVELKIPTKKTAATGSQPLMPGPADYQEFKAPPTAGNSNVPLSRVLPTYQKSAESALNKQDIPPSERKRVKNYFDSLKSGK